MTGSLTCEQCLQITSCIQEKISQHLKHNVLFSKDPSLWSGKLTNSKCSLLKMQLDNLTSSIITAEHLKAQQKFSL